MWIEDSSLWGGAIRCGASSGSGACAWPGGYPYGLRLTSAQYNDYNGSSVTIKNGTIGQGIKRDTNGLSGDLSTLKMEDVVIEQPVTAIVETDPRATVESGNMILSNVFPQDDFMGYTPCYVDYTDPQVVTGYGATTGLAHISDASSELSGCLTGPNYNGGLKLDGQDWQGGGLTYPFNAHGTPIGNLVDGRVMRHGASQIGSHLGPTFMPYATQNVSTNPASWTCGGTGCVVNTVMAPDGTMTAGELVNGSSGIASVTVLSFNPSTSAGDWIIYGARVRYGANNPGANGPFGQVTVSSSGATDVFDQGTANVSASPFSSPYQNEGWHAVVAANMLTSGTAAAHWITLGLHGGGSPGQGIRFWEPFLIYVPASAGITQDIIEQWRDLLELGVVPPNMPANVLAMLPNYKLMWGSDTNLYRGAAGVVQTDGVLNAVGGLQINGVPVTMQNAGMNNAPAWLRYYGDGSQGAYSCTAGTCLLSGENWYSSINISSGATVYNNGNSPLILRSTGTCTIAGTLSAQGSRSLGYGINAGTSAFGGGSAGGGGGTAAGSAGSSAYYGGSAGSAGTAGNSGGAASSSTINGYTRMAFATSWTLQGVQSGSSSLPIGGAPGGCGYGCTSSGGYPGYGACSVVLVCPTISFTGSVNVSGDNGVASNANNVGGGGGGGGGLAVMSAATYSANTGTFNVSGGLGGVCGSFTGCGPGGTGGNGISRQFTIQ